MSLILSFTKSQFESDHTDRRLTIIKLPNPVVILYEKNQLLNALSFYLNVKLACIKVK